MKVEISYISKLSAGLQTSSKNMLKQFHPSVSVAVWHVYNNLHSLIRWSFCPLLALHSK